MAIKSHGETDRPQIEIGIPQIERERENINLMYLRLHTGLQVAVKRQKTGYQRMN